MSSESVTREHRSPALERGRGAGWRAVQLLAGAWLVVSPFVLEGSRFLVAAKDVVVGSLLLMLSLAALRSRTARRVEAPTTLVLGGVLIAASIAFEFGPGDAAVLRQWNEVVVGVLLIGVAALRHR